ncbi:unnamed protein product [Vitrella brassicaformis CCMP3155]|uniref:SMP-30/Gluconolactonase/LRE-like region domain-containing protein n=1 Tax=Vitrella brassicaformis (strain CCMP3155) TaxID=1169540 RepID=A0A0G4E8Z5_VITBC|nr:unnamed protein product [Vitrella brassicaformis CCMP3155]|eukprot:CEL91675.1 unnamed protein product [Vitrella brassicaformis CCMP3155]
MVATAELAYDSRNVLGECPIWSPELQNLLWVDIQGKQIWAYDPESNTAEKWDVPKRPGSFALVKGASPTKKLLVAFEDSVSLYSLEENKVIEKLDDFEADISNTRANDGRADRQGRFVISGYNENYREDGKASAGIWRLDASRKLTKLVQQGVKVGNGLAFSLDGSTMFFCDSPTKEIRSYAYDADTGTVKEDKMEVFWKMPQDKEGITDGSAVDSEGYLWTAWFGQGKVIRISPKGEIDREIALPVPNPTCVAFGGKNLDTLFITTTRRRMTDEELQKYPSAGSLFMIKLSDVKGVEESEFVL